jgi:hypothetical protein
MTTYPADLIIFPARKTYFFICFFSIRVGENYLAHLSWLMRSFSKIYGKWIAGYNKKAY